MAIKGFTHKGVEEVFLTGRSRRIGPQFLTRWTAPPGVADLHGIRGFHALGYDREGTFAMTVSGNWRLTFRFEYGTTGNVLDVDFEDYH